AAMGLGRVRDAAGKYLDIPRHARVMCAVAASAAGTEALDTVYTDIADLDGLRRECEDAIDMGFTGKISIHPSQIAVINAAFTPDVAVVDEARELVAAFAEARARGVYAFTFKGQMVDAPHLTRARKILARAGVAWLRWTCGTCAYCTSARENLCARAEFTGYHADGGYAEYAVVPQAYVYPLPPVFGDAEAAPLLCAGIIGYRALKLAAVAPGGTLGLYGFGSSAHITLQIAVARGSTVYVCTREPAHRELARALGAAWVGEPSDRM